MRIGTKRRLKSTPPRTFALVSLVLIAVMVAVTGYTQSRFFAEELIQHEAVVIREMVLFLAREELQAKDFDNYMSASSQLYFERSFSILKNITGVIRIKLYNAESTAARS